MIEGSEGSGGIRLSYMMAGGGRGAFIGDVHRKAIALDGLAEIKAGCFSQDYDNTLATGEGLGLEKTRCYKTPFEMIESEGEREKEDRVDFIIIVTPNASHFSIAEAALQKGFHVVCDKPLTTNSRDARGLERLAEERNLLFCVTYAYSGYPIAKHIRDFIAGGGLGDIRFVHAEYIQDWLATPLEETGQKQSLWRTDPAQAGGSNCVGDIGTHIEHMVSYMSGLRIKRLSARLDKTLPGRVLDDNASILVEYDQGARGIYWSSQIAVGNDNGFRIRIFGSKASIQWHQENPNYVKIAHVGRPTEWISRGRDDISPLAQSFSRIPSGHPEGYFEAFANVYQSFISALAKTKAGQELTARDRDFPGVKEGLEGVRFIEKCVESSARGSAWVEL
jgi:predicted dehydrogenase